CIDLTSDPANCGACGRICDGYCINGTCRDCAPGQTKCGSACVDVSSDPANCGACGNVCPNSAPTCDHGTCSDVVCPAGLVLCFGTCSNLSFDTVNCGGCGIVCGSGQTCLGGICQYPF